MVCPRIIEKGIFWREEWLRRKKMVERGVGRSVTIWSSEHRGFRANARDARLSAVKCQATDKPKALILRQDPFALRATPTRLIQLRYNPMLTRHHLPPSPSLSLSLFSVVPSRNGCGSLPFHFWRQSKIELPNYLRFLLEKRVSRSLVRKKECRFRFESFDCI